MYEVPYALNIIDDNNLMQIATLEQRCRILKTMNISAGADACGEIMDYIEDVSGAMFSYDARIFGSD